MGQLMLFDAVWYPMPPNESEVIPSHWEARWVSFDGRDLGSAGHLNCGDVWVIFHGVAHD